MILIALGSNISGHWGSPRQTLFRALHEMPGHNIKVVKASELVETEPFGILNQPNYVNAVAIVETAMSPETLMRALHIIERMAGRKRLKRWGPRTLDLDLLDYHGLRRRPSQTSIKPLALPHPGIAGRDFVLVPLAEVAPNWKHPVTHQSSALMLRQLKRLNGD
jgi:2-amino-4-hydroxy-6-hydroxymethyldihydropteridine diphosphokinase